MRAMLPMMGLGLFSTIIALVFMGLSIYIAILLIKALNIYIRKNS